MNKTAYPRVTFLVLCTAYSLLQVGCAGGRIRLTEGVKLTQEQVATLKSGKSRDRQVLEALGPPTKVLELEGGRVFEYRLAQGGGGQYAQHLLVAIVATARARVLTPTSVLFFFAADGTLLRYRVVSREPE